MAGPEMPPFEPDPEPRNWRFWWRANGSGVIAFAILAAFEIHSLSVTPADERVLMVLMHLWMIASSVSVLLFVDRIHRATTAYRKDPKARHPWQFSLRSLLIVVTIWAVGCSILKMLSADMVVLVLLILGVPLLAAFIYFFLRGIAVITVRWFRALDSWFVRMQSPAEPRESPEEPGA